MIEFMKASVLGIVLTGVVALIIGSQGSGGGQLAIYVAKPYVGYEIYWSWPLFFAGTGLSWGLMIMQR
ncbi:hypothetical protein P7228_06070 [Altererythrobacter arenosus]|uniref:DUF3955 domain-containing protein n=1 Tax=Altererythrobacter arenosus TaxID=3032592 RepID=A0ABY8FUD3_9SPHN|nr:hypothetical protein [Altererythrobacter sp. CAU 1644]WFL78627.1 hypothetical protein P7228_06070 [Altererythrobacter sp. CAU 1644]